MLYPDLENKLILVVDDESRNWHYLKDIIEMCNGKAVWAESGMQALEKITNNPDIQLVLMDVQLPFMSGIETTKKIREINQTIPVIAQTAFSDPETLRNCTLAGCNNYILKPFRLSVMYGILGQYLC